MSLKDELDRVFTEVSASFPIKEYFNQGKYQEMYVILNTLKDYLPDFKGKKLLDIGSGPMDKTAIFQAMGLQCYAVDDLGDPWHKRNDNIIKIKKYAESKGITFYHQKESDHTIPYKLESFDIVCSLRVIEHLHESPRNLLNTMGTYLKPKGLLIITMPNSVNLRKRISVLMGQTNYVPVNQFFHSQGIWRGHVREYTLSETVYICKEVGFEVIASRTFENLVKMKLRGLLRYLYLLLGYILPGTRSGLLVICRKPASWASVNADPEAFRKISAISVPNGIA